MLNNNLFQVHNSYAHADSQCSKEAPCRYSDYRRLLWKGLLMLRHYRSDLLHIFNKDAVIQSAAVEKLLNLGIPDSWINVFMFNDFVSTLELLEKTANAPDVIQDCAKDSSESQSLFSNQSSRSDTSKSGSSRFDTSGSIFSCLRSTTSDDTSINSSDNSSHKSSKKSNSIYSESNHSSSSSGSTDVISKSTSSNTSKNCHFSRHTDSLSDFVQSCLHCSSCETCSSHSTSESISNSQSDSESDAKSIYKLKIKFNRSV